MTNFLLIIVTLTIFWNPTNGNKCLEEDLGEPLSKKVCMPWEYLKGELPQTPITRVDVAFKVQGIPAVSDISKSITLHLVIKTTWKEPRLILTFNQTKNSGDLEEDENEMMQEANNYANLDFNRAHELWHPDLYIEKLINFEVLSVLEPLKAFKIYATGEVEYTVTARVTIGCGMIFTRFPMDTQNCDFVMKSSSHEYGKLQFTSMTTVDEDLVDNSDGGKFNIAIFNLTAIEDDEFYEFYANDDFEQGKKYVGFDIELVRTITPFVLKYYLPCAGIVIVSQMSFLISPSSIPGRVALLVTLFLVLTNLFIRQQAETPVSREMTALGVYLLACLFFVFSAMIEFAIVLKHKRIFDLKASLGKEETQTRMMSVSPMEAIVEKKKQQQMPKTRRRRAINVFKSLMARLRDPLQFAHTIDEIAQIVFALAFALFNLIYWVHFTNKRED